MLESCIGAVARDMLATIVGSFVSSGKLATGPKVQVGGKLARVCVRAQSKDWGSRFAGTGTRSAVRTGEQVE